MPEDIVLKSVGNLTALSEGTWASMMDDFYGGILGNPGFKSIALVSETMGNDVALITTKYSYAPNYRFTQIVDKTQSRNNAIWNQLYKIINNNNIIIANVDKVTGAATDKQVLKGHVSSSPSYYYSFMADPLLRHLQAPNCYELNTKTFLPGTG